MKKSLLLLCCLCMSYISVCAQQIRFTPQWMPQGQFAGYYAALENGYYKDAGLDVTFSYPTQSYSSINMLLYGSTDIITSEVIQALMATDRNLKLVNLLQTNQHSTLVLLARDKNIERMSQLAGRRVGMWKVGFSEFPHMMDAEQQLGIEWIKFNNPLNLYISGAVDATLAKNYNEQVLFTMSGITPGSASNFLKWDLITLKMACM